MASASSQARGIKLSESGMQNQAIPGHLRGILTLYSLSHSLQTPNSSHQARGTVPSIWDAATGASGSLSGHTDLVGTIAWSPDGRYIASGSRDLTICVWDVRVGSSRSFANHQDSIFILAFSPDGDNIVSGSWDHTVTYSIRKLDD